MKQITRIVLACTLLGMAGLCQTAVAQSPNNVLVQIGASGATAIGGAAVYGNYLVLLDANGQIAVTMFPAGVTNTSLQQVIFIDVVNGDDTAGDGTIVGPYQTFAHAISVAVNTTTYVFAPGTYPNITITAANISELNLIGWDPDNTTMSLLKMNNAKNVTINLYGIRVSTLRQANNKTLDLCVYDRASVGVVDMTYTHANSWLTLNRDPSATVTTVPATFITDVLTHDAEDVGYALNNTTNWLGETPVNVEEALDLLAAWAWTAAGTNEGQMLYWNGTNWTYNVAATNTAWVLHGGSVPYFAPMAASNVVYVSPDGLYSNVHDVLDNLSTNITLLNGMTGTWTWAASSWSNSVAYGITVADTNLWNNMGTNITYGYTNIIPTLSIIGATFAAELTLNGTFLGSAAWWSLSNVTFSADQIVVNPLTSGSLTTTNSMTTYAGKTYRLIITTAGAGTVVTAQLGNASVTITDVGSSTNWLYPTASDTNLVLIVRAGALGASIDNVSLREATSGDIHVANDAHVGGDLYVGEVASIKFGDDNTITSALVDLWNTTAAYTGIGGSTLNTGLVTVVEYGVTFSVDMVPVCSPSTNFTQLVNIQIVSEDRTGFIFRVVGSGGPVTNQWPVNWNTNPVK